MIKFSKSDYEAIRHHGEETYPHECCGVLLGRMENGERIVKTVVRCGNTRTDSPSNRYHIAPQELIAAQKKARESGIDIVGFYHSHPDHPARWSATDLEEAHWFACSYVITSVHSGKASETNSFVLAGTEEQDKRFDGEQLAVND
jgi:proteasome lid subunit RPN8/RPN11